VQARPWWEVLEALRGLGVEVVREDDFQVILCRGAVKLQYLPKLESVPGWIQWNIVTDFGYGIPEYVERLRPNQTSAGVRATNTLL